MREFDWTDEYGDAGRVDVSPHTQDVRIRIVETIDGLSVSASHLITPDTARAVADALIEAARQIDGKTSGVVDLVRQLEAARAKIERLKMEKESACTPRAPKAEWFGAPFGADGKPTGKWDAWWVVGVGYIDLLDAKFWPTLWASSADGEFIEVYMDSVTGCLPVSLEGYPAPVGWSVVGG